MILKTEENDKVMTIKAIGEVNTNTSPELDNAVVEAAKSCRRLILDFSRVAYISSAGIRSVLKAHSLFGHDNFTVK